MQARKFLLSTTLQTIPLNEYDRRIFDRLQYSIGRRHRACRLDKGYILFFVRKAGLSQEILKKRLPQIRKKVREMFEGKLPSDVRILYFESPKTELESEILLSHEWRI